MNGVDANTSRLLSAVPAGGRAAAVDDNVPGGLAVASRRVWSGRGRRTTGRGLGGWRCADGRPWDGRIAAPGRLVAGGGSVGSRRRQGREAALVRRRPPGRAAEAD